jgi:hypothetical protein
MRQANASDPSLNLGLNNYENEQFPRRSRLHIPEFNVCGRLSLTLESIGKSLIVFLDLLSAKRKSLSFCKFIQNSGLVPKKCPKRKALSPVMERRPFRISLCKLTGSLVSIAHDHNPDLCFFWNSRVIPLERSCKKIAQPL